MLIAGIVAEYNPFHNGHQWHIRRTRAELGEDAVIVCCMSGDFVQRGEAAVYSKFARAEAAARCGADIVFELPLPWALSSAEGFARGAVGLLHALRAVDVLSFGSESGDAGALSAAAEALLAPTLGPEIRAALADGVPYAAARQSALALRSPESAELLSSPNNILAVEYIKALYDLRSDMRVLTFRREGAEHDGVGGSGGIRSASELRTQLAAGQDIAPFIPAAAAGIYAREREHGRGPVSMRALEPALLSRLRMLPDAAFEALPDAGEGLANRLMRAAREEPGWDGVLSAAKTRRYALSRLRRMCMCACLGVSRGMADGVPPYARILAATARGREALRLIAGRTRIPIITKPAVARELPREHLAVFELGAAARDLYVLAASAREERRGGSDWRTGPAVI